MDEPRPTQNFFSPHGERTATRYVPPSEWPVPVWRRRGALIGAVAVVLAIAGIVVGIVIAAPSSPPATANTAAVAPATTARAAADGKGKGNRVQLQPGESLVLGTVSSVADGQLVVTPTKGGDPVTVTTSATTRFAGDATSVTDLRQGERVQLIVKAGAAVAIRAREAPAGG
ncbi:MAG TPA: hypothetical protein VH333_10470 [Pseudonocardiaceae bacterium]|jgi:hypothetical protein|nr:hypothetical protein [Pseudonocardiaceae bacterium]